MKRKDLEAENVELKELIDRVLGIAEFNAQDGAPDTFLRYGHKRIVKLIEIKTALLKAKRRDMNKQYMEERV